MLEEYLLARIEGLKTSPEPRIWSKSKSMSAIHDMPNEMLLIPTGPNACTDIGRHSATNHTQWEL